MDKYKKGIGTKRSLVGEEFYEEFSSKFWLKPVHNEGIRRLSRMSFLSSQEMDSSTNSRSKALTGKIKFIFILFLTIQSNLPSETSSTIETHLISRPVTPTIPSFLQNANVINVTINYGEADEKQE
ncbi:hypothetical protein C1645_815500 [Glomus cerebriforme]|uniref:Uncharacterized protein n=1 Tax=Glomus cerebriforme TaxID=658196 RepID=A0A397TG46_9GLOM|nr:hypothetical protein C1645_815500 [Glomus cerebriforme]